MATSRPRRRIIVPDQERQALERIPVDVLRIARAGSSNIGDQSMVLEAIEDARAYGSRVSAACEMIGISVRTFERWRQRRRLVLKKLGEAGI